MKMLSKHELKKLYRQAKMIASVTLASTKAAYRIAIKNDIDPIGQIVEFNIDLTYKDSDYREPDEIDKQAQHAEMPAPSPCSSCPVYDHCKLPYKEERTVH